MVWYELILNNEYDDKPEYLGEFLTYEEAEKYKVYYKEKYGLKEEDFYIEEV